MAKRGSPEWRENIRLAKLKDPSHGYAAIHWEIRKTKTGTCSECGKKGWTDMAFRHHPQPYTRNREDFHELCRSCHKTMYPDRPLSENPRAVYMREWRRRQRQR